MTTHELQIKEMVERETRACNNKDLKLLMTISHPEMISAWPPKTQAQEPNGGVFWGDRYNHNLWGQTWQELFATHTLIHNRRKIRRIAVTPEGDSGFAVVDLDTLWRDAQGREFHWQGRACKVYSKIGNEWKMTMHTGLLDYRKAQAFKR